MLAILQVADTGPLDSIIHMLRAVGIDYALPNRELRNSLRGLGCDTVLEIDDLVRSGSYDRPHYDLPAAGIADMWRRDVVFVDIKAQKNYPKIVGHWPHLAKRVLWYRINGGKPEHVINARGDHGNEIAPPCPILTPNQWYAKSHSEVICQECGGSGAGSIELCEHCNRCLGWCTEPYPWMDAVLNGATYTCWPPFVTAERYNRGSPPFTRPICLVHNLTGWGYGPLIDAFAKMDIAMYGERSPNGVLKHSDVPAALARCMAYVHLKSSDAPGYALYEAMAAGCPVICTRKLIWKCQMQSLLIPDETCLVFDKATHDPFTEADIEECRNEVAGHLRALCDPVFNKKLGDAGRDQLYKVMWRQERDVDRLRDFMQLNFGAIR